MKRTAVIHIKRTAPETWDDALDRFLALRRSEGAAEKTLEGYRHNVELFFRRYPDAWGPTCRDCLIQHLSQKGIAPSTYNVRLKTLRPFFTFCTTEGAFSSSPAEGLKYRREEPRIVDYKMEDIKRLINSIGADTYPTLRDTCLIILSLDTGIRPSEALALLPEDVDLQTRRALVKAAVSKTRKARTIFFCEGTARVLQRLLDARPKAWEEDTPIFCTAYGTQWSTHAWSVNLRRYAKAAGLKHLSAYDLRHQHAIEALRNGMNVFALQKGMGHSTLSMTEKYLALSSDDLRKAYERSSPAQMFFPQKRTRAGKL